MSRKEQLIPLRNFASLGSLSDKDNHRRWERHKFAYLTMKNGSFARFARTVFIFVHFIAVLVLSTTWNDLFWALNALFSIFASLSLNR